jgi:hypothetical protein
MAQTAITWIGATGAPPIDGKATLRLEFSETVADLTAELFSFICYGADGKELSQLPAAEALEADAVIVNEYTLTLTNVPAEIGGRIKISINKSNIKPADKWWNLDGTTDETFVMVKYSGEALYVGDTATLQATVYPSSATPVWSSGSPEIATVDAEGRVTALSPGLTMITAAVGTVKDAVAIAVLAQPGEALTGIVWKGSLDAAPEPAEAGWAYYNTTDKKSYIYYGGEWHLLAADGEDENGVSIVWLGEREEPENPETGWAYYDAELEESRIWDGDSWETLSKDGEAGAAAGSGIIVDPQAKTVVIPAVFSAAEIQTAIESDAPDNHAESGWRVYVKGIFVDNAAERDALLAGITAGLPSGTIDLNLSFCYGEDWNNASTRIGALVLPDSVRTITKAGDWQSNLTSIYASGVTTIKNMAFYRCSKLTSAAFPQLATIEDAAVDGCEALVRFNAPAVLTIGEEAFVHCSSLTSVDFPLATSVGNYAFIDCLSLVNVDLPQVTVIGDCMFQRNYNLTSVNIPQATAIGGQAFMGCSSLATVNFPLVTSIWTAAFEHSGLTSADFPQAVSFQSNAFSYCTALKHVKLPKLTALDANWFANSPNIETLDISSVTNFSEFYGTFTFGSAGLNLQQLRTVNAAAATSIPANAFTGCAALTSVNLPQAATIGANAFKDSGITSLNLPAATDIGDCAFQNCPNLKQVSLPKVTTLQTLAQFATNGWFKNSMNIETINLDGVTEIPDYYFIVSDELEQPGLHLKTIRAKSATSIGGLAFYGCAELVHVNFPNVTFITDMAFYQCTSLETADFPKLVSTGINVFVDSTSLRSVNAPELVEIGINAFYNTALTTADFPKAKSIGASAFAQCGSLQSVNLPKATSIEGTTFLGCTNLITVNAPQVITIAALAFSECTNLITVNAPKVTTIVSLAFASCTSLVSIDLPKVETIGGGAFGGGDPSVRNYTPCISLIRVTLPADVETQETYMDTETNMPPFPGNLHAVYEDGGRIAGTYWRVGQTWTREAEMAGEEE